MGAWWTQTATPLLSAIGLIGSAAFAAWATRGKARRDENAARSQRVDDLLVQRDALYDYVYELRVVCHAHGINPPPWPKHAPAPWALKETADE